MDVLILSLKLTCHGGKPVIEEIATNFDTTIANLYWLKPAPEASLKRKNFLLRTPKEFLSRFVIISFEVRIFLYIFLIPCWLID